MAQKNFMRACKACSTQTMHIQQKPNHILHVLLSIFTAGLWLFVWIGIILFGSKAPQCTQCGKKAGGFRLT